MLKSVHCFIKVFLINCQRKDNTRNAETIKKSLSSFLSELSGSTLEFELFIINNLLADIANGLNYPIV